MILNHNYTCVGVKVNLDADIQTFLYSSIIIIEYPKCDLILHR